MKRLTSRQNPLVARSRKVANGDDRSAMLLDGTHLVGDALAAGLDIEHLIVASTAFDRGDVAALIRRADGAGVDVTVASPSVMDAISPVRAPSGMVALARRPAYDDDRVYGAKDALVVVACDVQDPGNVGAIVRVAEAAGASGVIAAGASADPFGWKALRGSMGSTLRLPVAIRPHVADAAMEAKRRGCRVLATVPRGGTNLFETKLTGAIATLIGGEGAGLTPDLVERADVRLRIPMVPPVESLNAAVTAALVLYEARRQRTR